MTISLTTKPTYPVPGRETRVAASVGTGNHWRLWCTAAPPGSELQSRIDDEDAAQVEVFAGDSNVEWRHTFDVPGMYVFSADDITRSAGTSGGGYQFATANAPTEVLNDTTTSLTVGVGQFLELTLGRAPDVAQLRLFVVDDTIRATNRATHGDKTPRVIQDGLTLKAQTAARDATVTTLVDALDGDVVTTALGTLSSIAEDIRVKLYAHQQNSAPAVHSSDDDQNELGGATASTVASGPVGIVKFADTLVKALAGHILTRNAAADDATGGWHDVGGIIGADYANAPIVTSAADLPTAMNALADAHRAYEAHRVDTTFHSGADSTNTLTALPSLLAVYSAFLAALANESPTTPATSHSGVVALVHSAGATPVT